MHRIRLPRGEWLYDLDTQLGPEGGFGAVYAGSGGGNENLAIKRLSINAAEAAHRELRIADELAGRECTHIIPIFDAGQDAESEAYFVIMARAERSLQDDLDGGQEFSDLEAAGCLLDIATGLAEAADIVHRDLKPGNVLFHEGIWKIGDFGIARFVEESTSLRTLRRCLTPPYAAPEQWLEERATSATDVYALGCIGYALLTGSPPFRGPEYRDQHLHEHPARIQGRSPQLANFLSLILRKNPEARPRLERVMTFLSDFTDSNPAPRNRGPAFTDLARAGAEIADRISQEEAAAVAAESNRERRRRLADEAVYILREIASELFRRIEHAAPNAEMRGEMAITLGQARIGIELIESSVIPQEPLPESGWDVIAGAVIKVVQDRPRYHWSASLWFTNRGQGNEYRWQEVSYFSIGASRRTRHDFAPFALTNIDDIDIVAGPAMHVYSVAFGPCPIDGEEIDGFCDRWAELLARAVNGRLEHPRRLPLQG